MRSPSVTPGSFSDVQTLSITPYNLYRTLDRVHGSSVGRQVRSGQRVVVVGAGAGGLSAAIDLAASGAEVTLVERASAVGGKIRQLEVEGHGIDSGPTVVTMRSVFEELFADAGADFHSYVPTTAAQTLARHAWADGPVFDLHHDVEATEAEIRRLFDGANADGYRRFVAYARDIYGEVEDVFIQSAKPSLLRAMGIVGMRGVSAVRKIDWRRTMWGALADFFPDRRLRQLFGRYATYYGSSPFRAPATLNLIAHVEQQGVWTIDGGMIELVRGFERLARELGVEIRCGEPVEELEVEGGRVTAVLTSSGRLEADAVVFNGDPAALAGGLLGGGVRRAGNRVTERKRSLSAVTWSMVAAAEGFALEHHNVFFSDDYPSEFERLASAELPHEPTVYVCAQDRRGADRPRPGARERLLCLVNAPAFGDRRSLSTQETERCERRTLDLMARCGLTLTDRSSVMTTPAEFEGLFPATGGALYGPACHGSMAPFTRPAARTKLGRLYLVGGGAHPGAGVPMVTMGGRIAARAVREDLRLTAPSRRAATSGGTSTSSATTVGTR